MNRGMSRLFATALAGGVLVASVTACSGSGPDDETLDENAEVTISVSDLPPTEKPEQRQLVLDRIAAFEAKYPNITVEATETVWSADSWNAMVAGGTLPTVMSVPVTEMRKNIAQLQVTDLTDYVTGNELLGSLNPQVVTNVQDADGHLYGVPIQAYTMGLLYNRDLFAKAGLDPDAPPTTWEQVRAAAKAITDKTGKPGFSTMTTENTGGWTLSTMAYGFGGQMETADGETAEAAFDNDATRQALQLLKDMRWSDDAMGDNFLVNNNDSRAAFAGGNVGMLVQGANMYGTAVDQLKMDADHFGLAPLPQDTDGIGTLGGGTIAVVSPDATPNQVAASIKWIQHSQLLPFTEQAAAVDRAKSQSADGLSVGAPGLPLFNKAKTDEYRVWIKEYVNVPVEHFALYDESVYTLPVVPEPPVLAQDLYASLDAVVQAVLTDADADVDALLAEAQSNVNALIAAA